MKTDVKDIKWLNEPKRWEVIDRIPKTDYKTLFKFKISVEVQPLLRGINLS